METIAKKNRSAARPKSDKTATPSPVTQSPDSKPAPTDIAALPITDVVALPITELEKIRATDLALADIKAEAMRLRERGVPTTKEEAKEVHDFTQMVVKVRTGALALAESIAAPYKEKQTAIMAEGKRIGGLAREAEDMTRPLKDKWEADQEVIRAEAKRQEARRLQQRFVQLSEYGLDFSGVHYSDSAGTVTIELVEVTAMPDADWDALMEKAKQAHQQKIERQQALETAARLKEEKLLAEQKRVDDEQAAERKRLQALADENRRVSNELQARQDEIDRKERKQQQQIEEQQWAGRVDQLTAAGFINHGSFFEHPDYGVAHKTTISGFEDEVFAKLIQSSIDATEQKKAEAAQAALDEKARLNADQERKKRLATDKNLLSDFFLKVALTAPPVFCQPEALALETEFIGRLNELVKEFNQRIDTL